MNWMGPTYGMWADTVDQMNEVIDEANRTNTSLEQWKNYAKKLEGALKDVAGKHNKVADMYVEARSSEAGQARLKDAALREIEKLDPSSKLLDPNYRKSLYDEAKDAKAKDLKKK